MLRVGLTGGIGCGKSTVASMMRELGCHVFDADQIARQVVEPGQPAYDEIVREFSREILLPDGALDRAQIAAIVFGDPARLARLNAIVHPWVLAQHDRDLERLERDDPAGIGVVEAPLLMESGYYKRLQRVILAVCTPEQQIERLTDPRSGRGMTREQAEARIAAQMSLAEKRRLATDEIDCSGTLEETRRQVTALVTRLKEIAAASRH
jgi:dephospho-CoA kinase